MADEKPTSTPARDPVQDPNLDALLTPEATREPAPSFKTDDFLAGQKAEKTHVETTKNLTPQVIKRGGIGFFTAFLMSSVAAGAGAYLALLAGSRPDLLQKAGIAAYVPQPPSAPSLGTSGANLDPLVARISAVEAELLTLKTRLDGTSSVVPSPATGDAPAASNASPAIAPAIVPPAATLADGNQMKGELQGISGRVTAIETRLAALDPTGAGGAIVAGLQADIAGLKAIIATLQQQSAAAPSPAATFAVVNLAEAANRAGPFMIEYQTLQAAMPNVPEVAALESYARSGVATRDSLQERFAALGPALASNQVAAKKEAGIWGWFTGLFSNMIKVQSAPNANGTGNDAILSRAKSKLVQGDLSGSLEDMATITNPPALVSEWVAAGRKRLELESRVSAVRGALGRAAISPTTPAIAAPAAPLAPPLALPETKSPAMNQGTNP